MPSPPTSSDPAAVARYAALSSALASRKRPNAPVPFPKTGYVTMTQEDGIAYIRFSPKLTAWIADGGIKYLQLKAETESISDDGRIPAFHLECETPDNPSSLPVSMSLVHYSDVLSAHPERLLAEAYCAFTITPALARIWPAKEQIAHVTQPFNSDRIRIPVDQRVFDRKDRYNPAVRKTLDASARMHPKPGFFYTGKGGDRDLSRAIVEVVTPDKPTVHNTLIRFNRGGETPIRECSLRTFRTWIQRTRAEFILSAEDLL